uniref:NADH dehydrogenase [ubiquinone] 1 alpha subcomplex subunit 6 n=1 Tax=Strigamia maritima TaxID=126957 RepID=T1JP04_STRMM
MASRVVPTAVKQVKPILSTDKTEARRRVLNLYKAWYRQIPWIVMEHDIPVNVIKCREKLREKFLENQHITDTRTTDMLVIKGQMELVEVTKFWKQRHHVMAYFKDSQEPRAQDFLSKFLAGHE